MPRRGNVLVVDDEKLILQMTKDLLEKAGFKVATASNTIGAGYMLKEFEPDLVVLDINLPGSLSGDQACDTLRTFKPGLRIVFYSGVEESQLKALAEKHKADGWVSKASRPATLLQTVEEILGSGPS